MEQKRGLAYTLVPALIVIVCLTLYSVLTKPDEANAQLCTTPTLVSCATGPGCMPGCGGFLSPDIVNSGFTPGVYGIQMRMGICML